MRVVRHVNHVMRALVQRVLGIVHGVEGTQRALYVLGLGLPRQIDTVTRGDEFHQVVLFETHSVVMDGIVALYGEVEVTVIEQLGIL